MGNELLENEFELNTVLVLKNIQIEEVEGQYKVELIDKEGDPILRGFGITPFKALNDLHNNLI